MIDCLQLEVESGCLKEFVAVIRAESMVALRALFLLLYKQSVHVVVVPELTLA